MDEMDWCYLMLVISCAVIVLGKGLVLYAFVMGY